MNAIWEWVGTGASKDAIPVGLDHAAEQLVPRDDQMGTPEAAGVHLIANAILDFAEGIGEHDSACSYYCAARNFDLIELAANDPEDAVLDPANRAEISRQLADLQELEAPGKLELVVKNIHERATDTIDLFEGLWVLP